jgi:ferric-dicitrate binding protein FerR (iron transport regulator)
VKPKNFNIDADSLIADVLSGNAGRADCEALAAWLSAGDANRRRFEAMRQAWLAAGMLCTPEESDVQGAFERLAQRLPAAASPAASFLPSPPLTPAPRVHRLRRVAVAALRMAAVWAVAFAVGALSYRYYNRIRPQPIAHFETIVPLGAKSQLVLTDGTKVWLNAGSRLRYSAEYSTRHREVELEGEGYFEVASNKAMPFEVKTSLLNVKATGTSFNVKAYPNDPVVETILVEGSVEVSRLHDSEAATPVIALQPKQRLTLLKSTNEMLLEEQPGDNPDRQPLDDATPAVAKAPDAPSEVKAVKATTNYMMETSWKDKRWRIENEDLGSIAVKLGRRYNVTIAFADDRLKSYRFTGTLEDDPIEAVLKAMTQSAPVIYKFQGSEILLSVNNEVSKQYESLWDDN